MQERSWAAAASIACYGIWFGEYPYDVLTIVDPPSGGGAAGGMEYPTLITVWGDRLAPSYSAGMEGVTIHEFGHQYFYGMIGTNEFEEAWLDEGFTSYTDARVYEIAYGPGHATSRYRPFHLNYRVPFSAFERYAPAGTPQDVADYLTPFAAAGCRTFNLFPIAPTPQAGIEAVAEVKQLLVARVGG